MMIQPKNPTNLNIIHQDIKLLGSPPYKNDTLKVL